MLICRTLYKEVKGSIFTGAVLCPLAQCPVVLVNTQKAVTPSRSDLRTVDWRVKQTNKTKKKDK